MTRPSPNDPKRMERAKQLLKFGLSLTKAATMAHVSPKKLKALTGKEK